MLSLFLCCMMTAVSSMPVWAAEDVSEFLSLPGSSGAARNTVWNAAEEVQSEQFVLQAADGIAYETQVERIGQKLRAAMIARQTKVTLYYKMPNGASIPWSAFLESAFAHTGKPNEGDYLRFHCRAYKARAEKYQRDGALCCTITYEFTYLTNAEQERVVDEAVQRVHAQIYRDGMSRYELARAIYDYICSHVTYDFACSADDLLGHSAYSALIRGKTVCQGYASLLYRLMLNEGIDCRMISGTGQGSDHGWNLVKVDESPYYYAADVTWDAISQSNGRTDYQYFLKGSRNFANHTPDADYLTPSFTANYRMSETDYRLENAEGNKWKEAAGTNPAESGAAVLFSDVARTAWSYNDIAYVYEKGLMNGVSQTAFMPRQLTDRGMIVAILYRLAGEPEVSYVCPFTDVKAGSYYEKAIAWAAKNGIVRGCSENCFEPESCITREQMAAIFYRYAAYRGCNLVADTETVFRSFNDASDVSGYAKPAVTWTLENGIIQGSCNRLAPQDFASREQTAAILHRFCEIFSN